MTTNIGIILVLIFFKLLQVEQKVLINQFLIEKAIILNRINNQKDIQFEITKGGYTYKFKSLEIAFSKKFKKNILDNYQFIDCFYLFTINKIYLANK